MMDPAVSQFSASKVSLRSLIVAYLFMQAARFLPTISFFC